MKKVLVFMLLALSLYANEASVAAKKLGYINSFDEGIAKAKKEHKMMMLVLVRDGCPWCKRLENDTLSDSFITDETKNFVNVLIDRNAKMPDYYRTPIVPVVYFVNPNTKESMFETAGYRDVREFLDDIESAQHEYNKIKK
ncbi:thioredoxin family protein [bacterium]|nr:thioredoxin family protein [bacterium]MBU1883502.1 thioredoxin family protein [bacterium]